MKRIGLICAIAREKEQLESRLQSSEKVQAGPFEFVKGALGGCEIIFAQSGIGKVNAALGVLELIKNFTPDYVINSGVAGGLSDTLNTLDCVVGTQCVYHDVWCGDGNEYGQVQELPTFFPADKRLLAAAEKLHTQDAARVHTGLICTGDQFVTTPQDVQAILKHFPHALACDMESAAMAQTCYRYHVPFLSLRMISDVAGKKQTHFVQFEDFWREMAHAGFERTWALLTILTQELSHE